MQQIFVYKICILQLNYQIHRCVLSSVQSLSCVWLFVTPWTAARQASLSITNSRSLLKLMSIESVMLPNHLVLCHPLSCPQSFPTSRSFLKSQLFASGGQSVGASASVSVLPVTIQGWFPLELTGWISLQSKGLSRVFSSITVRKQVSGEVLDGTHMCLLSHFSWVRLRVILGL